MELGPLQKKWIEALRSGKYEQGQNWLRIDNCYCCLGVAAEFVLGITPKGNGSSTERTVYLYNNESFELEKKDFEKLGLVDEIGSFKEPFRDGKEYFTLAALNDNFWTFEEIADYIEANPDNVFTRSA